ncbi:hypothetical protein ACODT5_03845 [Streptomyces sp. 5.8]|uniref:hypothetical protein n=1 Tax=Streptomyces sp. 5.8 TaxID=3406571 RepID=UPI003BB5CAE3
MRCSLLPGGLSGGLSRHAEVDRHTSGDGVDLVGFGFGAGEADAQALDFTELALALGFGDPVEEVVADPKVIFRLEEIKTDLIARRARAETEGWLGEIESIDLTLTLTLTLLQQKHTEALWLPGRPRTIDLGIPALAPRGRQER